MGCKYCKHFQYILFNILIFYNLVWCGFAAVLSQALPLVEQLALATSMPTHQCSAIDISVKKDDLNYSRSCHTSGVVFLSSLLRGCSAWTSGQDITSTTRVLSTCTSKMKPKKHIEGRCLSSRQWKMSDSVQSKSATTWFWKQFAITLNRKLGMS